MQDNDTDELNHRTPKILARMQKIPLLTGVASDQENAGTTETLTCDRDQASRFGIQPAAIDDILYDAFGQRGMAQYFTGNKAHYAILEALPSEHGKLSTLQKLYVQSSTGASVPLSTLVHETTVPVQLLVVNHQSQFLSVAISFNLKGNVLRRRGDAGSAG